MVQLKFDRNGVFIPQRINYKLKKDEEKEEMIEKYIKRKTNFQVDYDNEGNPTFNKKGKKAINNE